MRTLRALPVILLLNSASLNADDRHLHLSIGDPTRADREVELVVDVLIDTSSGERLRPADLPAQLQDVGILFLGETHTDIESHRVQARVIRGLVAAGRDVLIGLEMYPYTEQAFLDGWVAGHYTEEGFLELSRWYSNWGAHWGYYRDIFLLAKEHELPMFAINAPRDVVRSVRRKGFANLTEEEAAHVPTEIDFDSDDQRTLFKSMFDEGEMHGGMTDEQLEGMFQAQVTWDATMGFNAVKALREADRPNAIMVVLIGGGHVAYGLGIERQVGQWFDGDTASLVTVSVLNDEGDPIERVQASYADYIWGLPGAEDPFYPSLGLSAIAMGADPYRQVINVGEDTVAERAGFEVGDVLLSVDATDLADPDSLKRAIAAMSWGDIATFRIRREGQELDLPVAFTRTPTGD